MVDRVYYYDVSSNEEGIEGLKDSTEEPWSPLNSDPEKEVTITFGVKTISILILLFIVTVTSYLFLLYELLPYHLQKSRDILTDPILRLR